MSKLNVGGDLLERLKYGRKFSENFLSLQDLKRNSIFVKKNVLHIPLASAID